jgi:HK97 family phage major capsid protein
MKRLRELLEKRNRIAATARAIITTAEADGNRALTDEEQRNFDQAITDQDALRVQIEREQRLAQVEGELATARGMNLGDGGDTDEQRNRGRGGASTALASIGEGRYAVNLGELRDDERSAIEGRSSAEYNAGMRSYVRSGERRALDASSTGANGGFLTVPVQIAQQLLQRLDDLVFVRSRATVIPLPSAVSLGRVSLDTDAEDADWTDELNFGGEEDSMAFGRRDMTPHPLAKYAKVSNRLVRISTLDVMAILLQRIGYKFALTEEKAFLTGDGVQKPLGVYTPSADGIPTSRDIATGNTATSITFDGLINAKYGLKEGYLRNAAWNFGRAGIAQIAKLRDDSGAGVGTGQYLWQPSQQLGQPDRIHGIPVIMSEHTPSTFTSGKYVGMIADWSFYHIADALDMQVQRLNELFAMKNQTGIIVRKETDGMPVLGEAFVRVKLG